MTTLSATIRSCRREVRSSFGLHLVGALLALGFPSIGLAQATASAPPSPESYLGYSVGEAFTTPEQVAGYSRMLADASPWVDLREYGVTPEGRALVHLFIGRPDNLARLDEILATNAELTAGGTSTARAATIASTNPAIIYFSYGVHGDESSSSEAAMWTAHDLAGGDPALQSVLDSLIVVVDPVTNPDGRARYVNWYRSVAGTTPSADPQSREHSPPWPGGRYNHYLFDLNRDWAWATQPETRARLRSWWRLNPQVHVDFHEMSPSSSYFFFPAAPPINPIYPDHILAWGRRFGEANARQFDANGWMYYTGESYDMLYPGYGDSWPSLHGAIGMTFEQAGGGGAGLRYARADGDTLTLADRALHHRTSGAATLRTAAAGKSRLILDFAAAHRTAGVDEPDFLLVPDGNGRTDALVAHLIEQGIDVLVARQPFTLRATPYPGIGVRSGFPAGTIRVSPRQPRGRLALTLLQARTPLVGEFSYDISAWSLPYAYGIEAHRGLPPSSAGWARATAQEPADGAAPLAGYGYLMPPSARAAKGVVDLLTGGARASVLGQPATFAGRDWPAGSWFLPASGQADLADRLAAAGIGDIATAIPSGFSGLGPDIGSESTRSVTLPSIAIIGGDRISPTSYGAVWFYLEQVLAIPYSAILREDLEQLDLGDYDVLVLPDMGGTLTDDEQALLGGWVRAGGRLIAMSGGARATAPIAEVTLRGEAAEDDAEASPESFLATRRERERLEWESTVPGAIIELSLDPGHPLAWGAGLAIEPERTFVLHSGNSTFEPAEGAEAVGFVGADPQRISGAISDYSLDALANSVWLMDRRIGAGEIILFADDPLFRMFWKATHPLFLNAILLGG